MARKRSNKWMSFEDAKEFVREQQIQSRQQFLDWHDENKPKTLSKYPQRVYTKEWTGWNDFLGTNNEFNKTRRNWRDFNEAVVWAHAQKISGGKNGWLQWTKDHADDIPEDVPKRPDIVYKREWLSWKHWLGDAVREKIEAEQQARTAAIFYIIREREFALSAGNIYTFGVETGGVSALKQRWEQEKFQVVKMFKFDAHLKDDVSELLDKLSSPYMGMKRVRIVMNIHEVCWELQNVLDVAT